MTFYRGSYGPAIKAGEALFPGMHTSDWTRMHALNSFPPPATNPGALRLWRLNLSQALGCPPLTHFTPPHTLTD